MIVVRHQPGPIGWEFIAPKCNLNGGGKTLASSQDAAEHAARHYFTHVQGYPVLHLDACAQVRHVVDAQCIAA